MKSTDEVKVGAVTLGGFVILALMLTFLGVFSFASRQYKTMSMVSKSATKSALPVFRLERSMIFSSMGPKSRLS